MPVALKPRAAGSTLPEVLLPTFHRLTNLFARESASYIHSRYEIGRIVCEIQRNPTYYGKRAVDQLARALGRSRADMYNTGLFARRYTINEVEQIVRRRNAKGQAISWSHLRFLAQIANPSQRAALLETVLAKSVRASGVQRLIQEHKHGAGQNTKLDAIQALIRRTHEAAKDIDKLWNEFRAVEDVALMRRRPARSLRRVAAAMSDLSDQLSAKVSEVNRMIYDHVV